MINQKNKIYEAAFYPISESSSIQNKSPFWVASVEIIINGFPSFYLLIRLIDKV